MANKNCIKEGTLLHRVKCSCLICLISASLALALKHICTQQGVATSSLQQKVQNAQDLTKKKNPKQLYILLVLLQTEKRWPITGTDRRSVDSKLFQVNCVAKTHSYYREYSQTVIVTGVRVMHSEECRDKDVW